MFNKVNINKTAQIEEQRDITQNKFVRYQKRTVEQMLVDAIAVVQTPGTEVQLIADKALEIALLNDAMEVFYAGELANLEITSETKASSVIEQLTGKTWAELSRPTPSDRIADGVSKFINKTLNTISKGAASLSEKTRR